MKQITLVLILISILLINGCTKPNFVLLCQKSNNNETTEVYLLENHPKNKVDLEEVIYSFNEDLITNKIKVKRTFLKQHKTESILFGDKIDYNETGCSSIDNMDIIYEVSKFTKFSGKDTIIYRYFGN